jgi:hypothetical protein
MKSISPSKALYIKLGEGGKYESDCIEKEQTLRISYRKISHELCLNDEWDKVLDEVRDKLKMDAKEGAAKNHRNQIKLFYEPDETVLWVTFFNNCLYWCFSKPDVTLLSDKTKIRSAIDQWSCKDIKGDLLDKKRLSGRLLSMESYRGTICVVREFEYLKQKINGDMPKDEQEAREALIILKNKAENIIRKLHWRDFEILIDLIFRQSGWQRINELGGILKTLDLDLISPITLERYGVQIKSEADAKEFRDYKERFAKLDGYTHFYFIVHSPSKDLAQMKKKDENIDIWLPQDIADLAVKYGLADWIIDKAS